ncbi:MAG: FtsQ-type POTRA domain-containing protein [Verrucomicrobiota bacterium]
MSFFNRKQKNRRLGRVHVLDVKLRSDQVRRTRVRLAALACVALIGTILGVLALWRGGEWVLNRVVYENPAFAIRSVEVQTDGVIAPHQLRLWANVRLGQSLLGPDLLEKVKRNLEMVPAIETVSVERVLPKTLRIRVTEREPVLQIAVPQATPRGVMENLIFHLDAKGVVMQPLDPKQRTKPFLQADDTLPLLSGLKQMDLRPGRPVESPAVQVALRLATEFAYSPMAGLVDLKRIDVSAPDVLVVTTGQGSEVTFGLENLDQQMRRWRQVHEEGYRMRKGNLASLDLSVANNAPARWLDPKIVPPPAKPPKTIRNKKPRHV